MITAASSHRTTVRRPSRLAFAALALLVSACNRDPPRAENLLLITIDTLRADRLGAYGYARGTSPEIDRLAAESVVFDDAQVQASWTLPSIASYITSQYASTHGCFGFESKLSESFTTLGEVCAAAGFDTAGIVSHVFMGRRYGVAQGFAEWDEELVTRSAKDSHRAIGSELIADKAIAWLAKREASGSGKPFVLWLHFFDPHKDYLPHPGITERFGTTGSDRYDGEIAFTDIHVGRVLAALEASDYGSSTVVALFADHGEEFHEHGGAGHGRTLHEEVVRVPLIVRAPGIAPRRVTETVRAIDLMPTLLRLVSLTPPPDVEGMDLVPAMRGESLPALPALSEVRLKGDADSLVLGQWKLIVDLNGVKAEWKREPWIADDATAKTGGKRPAWLLFDRSSDPHETRDLAGTKPGVVRKLRELLRRTIEDARRKAERFAGDGDLTLSPEDLERMRQLGYLK